MCRVYFIMHATLPNGRIGKIKLCWRCELLSNNNSYRINKKELLFSKQIFNANESRRIIWYKSYYEEILRKITQVVRRNVKKDNLSGKKKLFIFDSVIHKLTMNIDYKNSDVIEAQQNNFIV